MSYRDDEVEQYKHRVTELESEVAKLERDAESYEERLLLARTDWRSGVKERFWLAVIGGAVFACFVGLGMWAASTAHQVVITSGFVVDRYHYAPRTTYVMSCRTIGKSTSCTPVPIYHPERWEVRIAHDGHDRLERVSEEGFNHYVLGRWACVEEPCSAPPPNVEEY